MSKIELKDYDLTSSTTLLTLFGQLRNKPLKKAYEKSLKYTVVDNLPINSKEDNTDLKEIINQNISWRGKYRHHAYHGYDINLRTSYLMSRVYSMMISDDKINISQMIGNDTPKDLQYFQFELPLENVLGILENIHDTTYPLIQEAEMSLRRLRNLINKDPSNCDNEEDASYEIEVLYSNDFVIVTTQPHMNEIVLWRYENNSTLTDVVAQTTFISIYGSDMINDILTAIIQGHKDEMLPKKKTIDKLTKLWSHQIVENFNLDKTSNFEKSIPDDFKVLYDAIEDFLTNAELSNVGKLNITYGELFDYFDEVLGGEITEKTQIAQEFIHYSSRSTIYKSTVLHENFKNISNKVKIVDERDANYLHFSDWFNKDEIFGERYGLKLGNLFEVNEPMKRRSDRKYMVGLHGTRNEGVMSILLNGLKTPNELNKQRISHSYTGNALGHGIYFTRQDTVSKAYQYSTNVIGFNERAFVIIAEIEYDGNTVYDDNKYGQHLDTSKYSLIRAENISRFGYSEYVVPHSKQINIRYIAEIVKK